MEWDGHGVGWPWGWLAMGWDGSEGTLQQSLSAPGGGRYGVGWPWGQLVMGWVGYGVSWLWGQLAMGSVGYGVS